MFYKKEINVIVKNNKDKKIIIHQKIYSNTKIPIIFIIKLLLLKHIIDDNFAKFFNTKINDQKTIELQY